MKKIFSAFAYNIQLLKNFIMTGILFMTVVKCYSQGQESVCGQKEILFPTIKLLNFPSPKPGQKSEQDDVLTDFQMTIAGELTRNNTSLKINRVFLPPEDAKSFFGSGYKYILLATIVNQDGGIQLRLTLQSSCSDKVLAKTDVFLPNALFAENPGQVTQAARQAASTLSSLIKIKEFELQERKANNYGLGGDNWGGTITIAMDKTLVKGQETQVQMKVMDCDGEVLRNKLISTERTIGGIFTPATFTTNADGIATGKFKMTSDKRAIIVAQCKTKNVQGCQDLYTGTEVIKGIEGDHIKVTVKYKKIIRGDFNMASDEDKVVFKAGEQSNAEVVYSFSILHSIPSAPKEGEQIMMMPEFEDDPAYEKTKKGKTVILQNEGYSIYIITGTPLELVQSPVGAPPTTGKAEQQRYYSDIPSPPAVSLLFKNNDLIFFSGGVEFPEAEDGLSPVSSSFSLNDKDKGFPVKPKKVTDTNSPYKWVYEFEYNKGDSYNKQGKVFKQGKKETETATVQIWKTF